MHAAAQPKGRAALSREQKAHAVSGESVRLPARTGDFLHAIMGPKGDPSFGPRVRDAVCTEIIQTILHERYRNDPSPFVQYYVAFYASAYLGVITHWIETGMKESSQEMALVAMRLFFIKPGDPIRL